MATEELARDWLAHLTAWVGHRDPQPLLGPHRRALPAAARAARAARARPPAAGRRATRRCAPARRPARRFWTRASNRDRHGWHPLLPNAPRRQERPVRAQSRSGPRPRRPAWHRPADRAALPTAAELEQLLDRLSATFRPVASACTFAGLRISEALGLRWRDVDLAAGELTVAGQLGPDGERVPLKSAASAATVPLLPALARELRSHRSELSGRDLRRVHPDALVFTTARGPASIAPQRAPRRASRRRRGWPERRQSRANRTARSSTQLRRARASRRRHARRDNRACTACERACDCSDLRRARRRRP